jgi:hypothetical protein
MSIQALEDEFALTPLPHTTALCGPYCDKKAMLLLFLLRRDGIHGMFGDFDNYLYDEVVDKRNVGVPLYFELRFGSAEGLYDGLIDLINDPTKWHVVQAVVDYLGDMEYGLSDWLEKYEGHHCEEDVPQDVNTMIVWAKDYDRDYFFLDKSPRLAKERQAKEHWVKLFACVKFLAVHKRATVSANMPSRKRDRGEFEVDGL